VSEETSASWPAVGVEPPQTRSFDASLPDQDGLSILELAGIDLRPADTNSSAAGDGTDNGSHDLQPGNGGEGAMPASDQVPADHDRHPDDRRSPVAAADTQHDGSPDNGAPYAEVYVGDDRHPDDGAVEVHVADHAQHADVDAADTDHPAVEVAQPGGDPAPGGERPPEATSPESESTPPATVTAGRSGWDPTGSTQILASPRTESQPDPPSAIDQLLGSGPLPDPSPSPPAAPATPPTRPPLPRWMAIANQKGGVGKTTTAVNLGASLAELGYRVLVVDLDPQGNATTGLGVNARNLQASIYDVLLADLPMEDCIEPTGVRNLFVAPATIDLAGAEIELVPAFSRELRLRRALESLGDEYDFVLIDCPPSLGLLTVNGLAAATEVVVPIQCEYYALEGLGQLMRNVQLVQRNLNPRLEMSTIILTMYDARTKLAEQVAKEVRRHFGPKVCRNIVPRTVRLSEAPSFGQPILVFDSTSRGALAYRELAKEVSGGAPQRTR